MPGLFANTLQLMEPSPIPLGPCAQLHLTCSLLPAPFFRPTAQLKLSASPCGGVGSLQYCYHFNPQDDDVSSLTDISWNSHHLPPDFLADLFGVILVMRTFSSPLPLLVPVTQSFLLSQFGVLRTPLTLLQTTPSPFAIPLKHHSRAVVPLSPLLTGIPQSPLVAQFGNATILTLLTLRFSLTSFLVFSSVGLLFGPWKSFRSGKPLKTHSML